jgi:hypothetical protein
MREIYQYSETQMIMDIREELDMYRVYASDRIVIKNVMHVREKFEQAISYVTENMQTVESVIDKSYIEILDTFIDSLHQLTDKLTKKSILSDQY